VAETPVVETSERSSWDKESMLLHGIPAYKAHVLNGHGHVSDHIIFNTTYMTKPPSDVGLCVTDRYEKRYVATTQRLVEEEFKISVFRNILFKYLTVSLKRELTSQEIVSQPISDMSRSALSTILAVSRQYKKQVAISVVNGQGADFPRCSTTCFVISNDISFDSAITQPTGTATEQGMILAYNEYDTNDIFGFHILSYHLFVMLDYDIRPGRGPRLYGETELTYYMSDEEIFSLVALQILFSKMIVFMDTLYLNFLDSVNLRQVRRKHNEDFAITTLASMARDVKYEMQSEMRQGAPSERRQAVKTIIILLNYVNNYRQRNGFN